MYAGGGKYSEKGYARHLLLGCQTQSEAVFHFLVFLLIFYYFSIFSVSVKVFPVTPLLSLLGLTGLG